MKRPNLFQYATRELSQDAMVCWLLKCCHAEDPTYREIGLRFVKFILQDDSVTPQDIELEEHSPYNQYYHMDVYANVRVKDKIIPLIFEDKTDTFLHGKQHIRYCERVQSWKKDKKWAKSLFSSWDNPAWGNTVYVLFKTGYLFGWQEAELEKVETSIAQYDANFRIITLDDMIGFLDSVYEDELLLDYKTFLKQKRLEQADCIERKCDRYYQKIFGGKPWFHYDHQQWSSKDFMTIDDANGKEENRIWIGIGTQWLKKEDKYQYAVIMYQYRKESGLFGSAEEKEQLRNKRYEITEKTGKLCERIFQELNPHNLPELEYNDKNRMPDKNRIFKVFINDSNEDEVCEFFKHFVCLFRQLAVKELGGMVIEE